MSRTAHALDFNPDDPFPLLALPCDQIYQEAQEHAQLVDQFLGLKIDETEARLQNKTNQQTWSHLPARIFLTPYAELRSMLDQLHPKDGATFIDLGAGYGRMGFVLARHFPNVHFIGYECAEERVQEGSRCLAARGCNHAHLLLADLSQESFAPAAGDFYFIYDFGTKEAISKTLRDLKAIATSRTITVIGRGRASRDAIEKNHPWLSQVVTPEHTAHYSIYRSAE